jgi:tRNA(fMet)-specific endonuclease VapC
VNYLLDTNAISAVTRGHAAILERLRSEPMETIVLSSIVLHELYFGAYRSGRERHFQLIEELRFAILEFDRDDARAAARLRATLRAAGTPIGPYDVLIAGQALARGLTLVTRNTREFARVEGLAVEDWEAS